MRSKEDEMIRERVKRRYNTRRGRMMQAHLGGEEERINVKCGAGAPRQEEEWQQQIISGDEEGGEWARKWRKHRDGDGEALEAERGEKG